MLIDIHTHVFDEKIACKAIDFMANHYTLPVPFNGQFSELNRLASAAHFDAIITLVAATKPSQVHSVNTCIRNNVPEKLSNGGRVVKFGCFHVGDVNWMHELDLLEKAGIKGIKIHPEFQGFDLADPRLFPFLEAVGEKFVLMIHIGAPTVSDLNKSTPQKLANLAKQFPRVKFIAAHMGGYLFWNHGVETLCGLENIWFDTSSALEYMTTEQVEKLYHSYGVEKILLGSDYPMLSPGQAYQELLMKMPWLSVREKELITGVNASNLLAINA